MSWLGSDFLANKSKKVMQQLIAAKKSPGGRAARRAVDMLIKSTAVSPIYRNIVAAAKPPRRNPKKSSTQRGTVSMCVGKMIYAGCNPFHQMAQGACIPDGNSTASVRGFVRKQVTVTVGSNGVGFCHFFVPLSNDTIAFAYSSSGVTFTGLNCQFLSANNTPLPGVSYEVLPTNVTSAQLNNGWGAADDRAAFSARVVAAGFCYRYTGKEIDRAGQVYTYSHPAHNSSASMLDASGGEIVFGPSNISQFLETHVVEAAREDTYVPLFPVSSEELDYSGEQGDKVSNLIYPWSQGATRQPGGFTQITASNIASLGIPICTMIIVGTAGSTYNVNYGQHSETVGIGVSAYSKIAAESDTVGVQDVITAYSRFSLNRRREPGVDPVPEFKRAISSIQKDRASRMAL